MKALALAVLVLVGVLLWRQTFAGRRHQARRHADLPAPRGLPVPGRDGIQGVYVSTTTRGDPLDRVTAHGLGARGLVRVVIRSDAVLLHRDEARSFVIASKDLIAVRREPGSRGTFTGRQQLVVLTWRLGQRELDTTLRTRHPLDGDALATGVSGLLQRAA